MQGQMPRLAIINRQINERGEWAVEATDEIGGAANVDASIAASHNSSCPEHRRKGSDSRSSTATAPTTGAGATQRCGCPPGLSAVL